MGFAPIVRVDEAKREIELCATSEAVDAHGTVFAYAASRDAFARWAGNVREMHERKAVGRRVAVRCDDTARKVYVRVRISRGAEDTWLKVLDGTLQGASIGAANVVWRHQRGVGKTPRSGGREPGVGASGGRPEAADIPIATRYDLVELSLVDLPSNPDALGITLVRDGVPLAEVLDDVDEREEGQQDERDKMEDKEYHRDRPAQPGIVQRTLPWDDPPATHPDEGAASDGAEAIAAAVLARGRAEVAGEADAHIGEPASPSVADTAQRSKRDHLAALGAPGYIAPGPAMNGRSTDGGVNAAQTIDDRESLAHRARGPFSTNPAGPPDMGVPARADERPTLAGASGGRPPADVGDHGYDDEDRAARLHNAARAILRACGCDDCRPALAALDDADADDHAGADGYNADETLDANGPMAAARFTRALDAHLAAHTRRLNAAIAAVHQGVGELGALMRTIERRVAVIEEQPMPGGPQLRVADKTHALLPGGEGALAGVPGVGEQLRALEALAGRLRDPQAQIAVATEMIRLQQQAAGLAPDLQAMPRAGSGGY